MIKKSVIYLSLLVFVSSCEKDKYIAEFSYSVSGETFTVKGGGLSYTEWFTSDTVKNVLYRSQLYARLNNGKMIMMDTTQSYNFAIQDITGGYKSHFDIQNHDEVYPLFTLTYKGNQYKAISGFINIEKLPKNGLKGFFEAVMVYPFFYPTDTIIVKNGSFYYSEGSYGNGSYD